MSSKKEELELELKQLIGSLGKLQKNNPTLLCYLPSSLKVEIDKALFALDNASENNNEGDLPCLPMPIFKQWYERVINFMEKAIKNLQKDSYQCFDKNVLAIHQGTIKPKYMSNKDLEDYIVGLACAKITPAIGFGLSSDLIPEAEMNQLGNIWQQGIGQSKCLDESFLPPTNFLAKRLIELYIESSKDTWFEIDPGEYSTINAGYIYFGYSDVRINESGLVNTEDQMKCIPMLDDTVDGENVIKTLKELYGNNARLIDLPIKMKLSVTIVLSEAVSSGRGSGLIGGVNGWSTMVFDRDINGSWTQVFARKKLWDKKLLETGTTNFDFEKFISTLLSKFKLKDLIADH
jgi:hypothetical protein